MLKFNCHYNCIKGRAPPFFWGTWLGGTTFNGGINVKKGWVWPLLAPLWPFCMVALQKGTCERNLHLDFPASRTASQCMSVLNYQSSDSLRTSAKTVRQMPRDEGVGARKEMRAILLMAVKHYKGEISWETFSSSMPQNLYRREGSYIWLTLRLRSFPSLRWLTRQVHQEISSGMAVTITWIFLTISKVLRTKHCCDPTFTTAGLSYV